MKLLLALLFVSGTAFADCDLAPLKKELVQSFKREMPIKNAVGEPGMARVKNMLITDHLLSVKNENFLIATFDMHLKWMKSEEQVLKTQIVASVDLGTCTIEGFAQGDVFGSSLSEF